MNFIDDQLDNYKVKYVDIEINEPYFDEHPELEFDY